MKANRRNKKLQHGQVRFVEVPEPKRTAKKLKELTNFCSKRGRSPILTEPRIIRSYGTIRQDLSAFRFAYFVCSCLSIKWKIGAAAV